MIFHNNARQNEKTCRKQTIMEKPFDYLDEFNKKRRRRKPCEDRLKESERESRIRYGERVEGNGVERGRSNRMRGEEMKKMMILL